MVSRRNRQVTEAGSRALLSLARDSPAARAEELTMLFQSCPLLVAITLMATSCTSSSTEGSLAAKDPNVPGATGQTVVVGSHSSMAGSDRVHPNWNDAALSVGIQR
jgi:hypothetical protein